MTIRKVKIERFSVTSSKPFEVVVAALVEQLDLKNAMHVGHSTGGGEVVRYIGRHGNKRVSKAVLIGAIPLRPCFRRKSLRTRSSSFIRAARTASARPKKTVSARTCLSSSRDELPSLRKAPSEILNKGKLENLCVQ